MNPSTSSTASDHLREFTCFANLPLEIRLRIWELVAPRERNAVMDKAGARSTGLNNLDLGISLDGLSLSSHGMVETCPESLKVIDDIPIGTMFIPLRRPALVSLASLHKRVDAIATLWPEPRHLEDLHKFLVKRKEAYDNHRIKTIYIGLSGILWTAKPKLGGTGFRVYDLDDISLLPLLSEVTTRRDDRLHSSDECFLENLKVYWEKNELARELQETWERLILGSEKIMPILKPVVVFANSRHRLHLGSCSPCHGHRILEGLIFAGNSVHRHEGKFLSGHPIKMWGGYCDEACRTRMIEQSRRELWYD
ncbi:hypothetical protein FPOAC1_006202 [Fusarium poae]|uniref:hypothetical protein n=1 Tax=Fusarium poae TaxID=36050 RepID=UPI001CE9C07A|nr:hypothetical protein FPOAC1_006202 [Fusarium poae]KAG8672904.1 hypothetical protein FPOAC1_006202 [Fusarium poae]